MQIQFQMNLSVISNAALIVSLSLSSDELIRRTGGAWQSKIGTDQIDSEITSSAAATGDKIDVSHRP